MDVNWRHFSCIKGEKAWRKRNVSKTLALTKTGPTSLDSLPGWDQLKEGEMELVRSKSQSLSESLYLERKSRAAAGKLLIELRTILDPKGLWGKYLLNYYGMSKSTAYNYINDYTNLTSSLPPPFVEIVLQRGFNIRREVLKRMPPPKTDDPEKITAYLEAVQKKAPRPVLVPTEPPDALLRNCVHFVETRWKKLPKSSRVRERFKTDFIGMCLGVMGAESAERFHPVQVPEHLQVQRGRPRKIA